MPSYLKMRQRKDRVKHSDITRISTQHNLTTYKTPLNSIQLIIIQQDLYDYMAVPNTIVKVMALYIIHYCQVNPIHYNT